MRRAWDQITKPSASTALHTRKSQVEAANFALAYILNIILRSGYILFSVSQGRFGPPCGAGQSVGCMCAARVHGPPVRPRGFGSSRALVRSGTALDKPTTSHISAASVARRPMKSSSASSRGSQLPKRPSRCGVAIPTPNPSVEARPNGKPPGPVHRYGVHFLWPGPGVLPSAPPHLQR